MKKKGVKKKAIRNNTQNKTSALPLILEILALLLFIPLFISTINYYLAFSSGFVLTPLLILGGLILSIINLTKKKQNKLGKTLNIISLLISAIFAIVITLIITMAN